MLEHGYAFAGLVALGIIFFYLGCIGASRPAKGTTEWISYKCANQLIICPEKYPLGYLDILPIIILAAISFAVSSFAIDSTHIASSVFAFLDVNVFGNVYLSHFAFSLTAIVFYVLVKNLAGGYIVPVCSTLLLAVDYNSAVMANNTDAVVALLFTILAMYFAYRLMSDDIKATVTGRFLWLAPMGITLGLGMSFNGIVCFAMLGLLIVFMIRGLREMLVGSDMGISFEKVMAFLKNGILYVVCGVILPLAVYIIVNGFDAPKFEISSADILTKAMTAGAPVFLGGICSAVCCIYLIFSAKDGKSLFAVIMLICLGTQIILAPNAMGFMSMVSALGISRCFDSLEKRKMSIWIIIYMIVAAVYLGTYHWALA